MPRDREETPHETNRTLKFLEFMARLRKNFTQERPETRLEDSRRCPAQHRPVFLLAQHRSGGTLLTRLLHCHDKLVVLGEHAGFLDGLAEAYAQLERSGDQLPHRSRLELRRYVRDDRLADVEFRPWMSLSAPLIS